MSSTEVIVVALVYLAIMFAVASWGDANGGRIFKGHRRSMLYALGLGVYCTSWTFYGSVGLASRTGFDFIPVYLGPILVLIFGRRMIVRALELIQSQHITSIADFLSARYGKRESVAATVALIMVIGTVPYIALQIKAISSSMVLVENSSMNLSADQIAAMALHAGLVVSGLLALFAMAFGTRRIEATEHQDGLMFAIAIESVVKLLAFLSVGILVTWGLFPGPSHLLRAAMAQADVREIFTHGLSLTDWIVVTLLSGMAVMLLPRQFHVMFVENRDRRDVERAAMIFPTYLVLINLFVVPIAMAGLLSLPQAGLDRDWTVLALPLATHHVAIALVAMIGGFSAATAMVIVACVALSIMVSNDLVIPMLLRWRALRPRAGTADITVLILLIRRVAIAAIIACAYLYLRFTDDQALVSIGLLSFAAIAQVAPAFIGGIYWRGGTARGVLAGLIIGFAAWFGLLFLPSLFQTGPKIPDWMLAEHASLFVQTHLGLNLSSLSCGALISLALNIFAFVAVSRSGNQTMIEQLQTRIFVGGSAAGVTRDAAKPWRSRLSAAELEASVARYLGPERARLAFATYAARRGRPLDKGGEIDIETMRFAEQTLASVIGAASARLVLSLTLRQHNFSRTAALEIVDEASAAIRDSQNLLQHAIDFAQQGITVFDSNLQLVFWNREFIEMFNFPPNQLRMGMKLEEIVRNNIARGIYGPGDPQTLVARRIEFLTNRNEPSRLRLGGHDGRPAIVIEVRSSRMPEGGLVTTYSDVSLQVEAEETLGAVNETLEQRVRERTDELTRLNAELERARASAEDANQSKTRFLAAASHDILQPLNAARLFSTALVERGNPGAEPTGAQESADLARKIDASLEAVEEILTALLDMSRLDAGAMKAETTVFRIDDILNQLKLEFAPLAEEKHLKLTFAPCHHAVRSDRRLLRRLLQNLVSNAIKYTPKGRVLVGCRVRRGRLKVEIWDTGLGIPENKHKIVFQEFERLESGARTAQGLGLGLSIVERIARVLGHRIILESWPGKGSMFAVEVPVAANMPSRVSVPESQTASRHLPLEGLKIIAIDDEARILEGMTVLLEGWGCQVMTALGLNAAAENLRALHEVPDAILADYHLGDELGIDVIAALRAEFGMQIPAILMTADRSQAVRVEATMRDINLLHKPVKPAALRALLTQWRVARQAAE